jgi:hypothetical protein
VQIYKAFSYPKRPFLFIVVRKEKSDIFSYTGFKKILLLAF